MQENINVWLIHYQNEAILISHCHDVLYFRLADTYATNGMRCSRIVLCPLNAFLLVHLFPATLLQNKPGLSNIPNNLVGVGLCEV